MSNTKLNQTLSGLGGRFFGLHTKQGGKVNARVVTVTPNYVTVFDRNAGQTRKFAKSSIAALAVGGQLIR